MRQTADRMRRDCRRQRGRGQQSFAGERWSFGNEKRAARSSRRIRRIVRDERELRRADADNGNATPPGSAFVHGHADQRRCSRVVVGGDSVGMPGRPLHQFDAVAIRVGERGGLRAVRAAMPLDWARPQSRLRQRLDRGREVVHLDHEVPTNRFSRVWCRVPTWRSRRGCGRRAWSSTMRRGS
jgi:hypothetical protein